MQASSTSCCQIYTVLIVTWYTVRMSGVHYTTRIEIPNRRWRALGTVTAACLVMSLFTGCGQTQTPAAQPVTLRITQDGFLQFSGGGEEDAEEIERLNEDIAELVDEYQETLDDDGRTWTVVSQSDLGERILQGTIYITRKESSLLMGEQTTHQLASYAYDTETHTGYTAQDALEADPLTGVELSTRVKKAFNTLEPEAELLTTEMQGFVMTEDATTEFLYMRVESDEDAEDPDNLPIEQFYLYDPGVDAMSALAWPTENMTTVQ